ncbi:hypothetical protein BLX24_13375 [Arsenicibacter rosenii]|uniref:Uncharacterized protein n=1 Tax=Arsenicibacter rosenii TaxID=1750698 RepID=A0A1S2VJJ7_9BACT|nr:hypothetical protein BLX24_13375 [Arsenicibacter rosenii]
MTGNETCIYFGCLTGCKGCKRYDKFHTAFIFTYLSINYAKQSNFNMFGSEQNVYETEHLFLKNRCLINRLVRMPPC